MHKTWAMWPQELGRSSPWAYINNESPQITKTLKQKVGHSSNKWSKCGENFPTTDFKSTITVSIFVRNFYYDHILEIPWPFASNGIDLAEIWALCQKITAPEARPPSKYAMQP
jgi:hypothetical protein